jgi:D-cysteine desulfhydrase
MRLLETPSAPETMAMVHPERVDVELSSSLPTPVLDLTALTPDFGPGRLLVKNDGLSGQTYGGNKTRKLAQVFQVLRRKGIRHVLTAGTAGSHHVLAMGLYAPVEGIDVTALLLRQPHTPHAESVLRIISALDIERLVCPDAWAVLRHAPRLLVRESAWIGPGALGVSSTRGYVTAYDEWASQRRQLGLGAQTFEHHVVAAGSGGTAAGLLAGLCAHNQRGRVVAVAVNDNPTLRALIVAQATAVSRPQFVRDVMRTQRLHVTREALGEGYGLPTPQSAKAIAQAAPAGLTLEHTYTAKAFSVASNLTRSHPADVVVFWQTLSQRSLDTWLCHAAPLSHLDPAVRQLLT